MLVGDGDVVGGWVKVHGLSFQAILPSLSFWPKKEAGDCKTTGTVLTRSCYDLGMFVILKHL